MKRGIYPTAIGVALLGLAVWLPSQFQISIQFEETPSVAPPPPVGEEPTAPALPSPAPSVIPDRPPVASPLAPTVTPEGTRTVGIQSGALRVSNQTDYPLRVALLSQRANGATGGTNVAAGDAVDYGEPVHWDFAPQEGNAKGLLLALPEGEADLRVQTGDVLIAFAQDGSRRYWGPYVVGETPLPAWNAASSEWDLVLSK
ncbi:MAG: hypothetical protein D6742_03450 [Cyanobacteria bacterium J069]|nr:MAG: hypothetical protein D6742_03450 [Cyanobacteria bacterium J069]